MSYVIFHPAFCIHAAVNPEKTKSSRKLRRRRFISERNAAAPPTQRAKIQFKIQMALAIFVTRFSFSKVDFKFKSAKR